MNDYKSLKELYDALIPAFNIKLKELKYKGIDNITRDDIWNYLKDSKWKTATNLGISDMVSDIMNVSYIDLVRYKNIS